MPNRSDQELISAYIKGEKSALDMIINRWTSSVYGFVCHFVKNSEHAEDITQEVFIKLWKKIKRYDKKRNFKTWLFTIAKNSSLDFLKKKKLLLFSEFIDEDGENILENNIADQEDLPDKIFERNDLSDFLEKALTKLSPDYRVILLLRYKNDFTFQEISEILKRPLETVRSQYRRALSAFANILRKEDK